MKPSSSFAGAVGEYLATALVTSGVMNLSKHARFCLALTLWMAPAMLGAQTVPIPLGARVRVEMHDESRLDGILMSQTADSVVVASPPALHAAVATEHISRVRRSEGKSHGGGAWKGLKIGALVGGGATALVFGGAYLMSSAETNDVGSLGLFILSGAVSGHSTEW